MINKFPFYTIGVDYGTNSVRAIVVNCNNGQIISSSVFSYPHGENGIIVSDDPNVSRQHPRDYIDGLENTISKALKDAAINN